MSDLTSPTGDWGEPALADSTLADSTLADSTLPDSTLADSTLTDSAPAAGGGAGGWSSPRTRRRRFTAAVGAAVILGGGAGALATALAVGGGTTTVVKDVATASAAADATTVQGLVAKVEPALVDIETTGTSSTSSPFGDGLDPFGGSSTEQTSSAGTGMIISSDGLILTNAHVLEGADSISVIYDGQTTSHRATLVGEDAAKDIALIKVTGASNLPTVTLAGSSAVQIGDSVLAIGNALNLQSGGFTVSNGIISALDRSISTDNGENLTGLEQTSAAISSGDSGGALVDSAGQVIGMNTATASSSGTNTASDIGFAIPSSEILSLIPRLEKGNIGTPTTGSNGDSSATSGTGSSGQQTFGGEGQEIGGGQETYGGYGSFSGF